MNNINTTKILRYPSALRGASRVVDMFGKLDEYKVSKNSDYDAIKNDWQKVGETLATVIGDYGKTQKRN